MNDTRSSIVRRIQIVFANYHCATEISVCLESLAALASEVAVDVVVVENGGCPFVASEEIAKSFGIPLVLHPSENTGYFGALRCAIDAVPGDGVYQLRILCNPDVEFFEGDPMRELSEVASRHGAAIVAPSVISTLTGRDQNPYMRQRPGLLTRCRWKALYSSLATYILWEWISGWWHRRRRAYAGGPRAASQARVYAAHGSFLAFSEAFVQTMSKHFNAMPFLYGEELVLAELCQRYGWVTLYAPSIAIKHHEHSSTGKLATRQRFEYQRRAISIVLELLSSEAACVSAQAPKHEQRSPD